MKKIFAFVLLFAAGACHGASYNDYQHNDVVKDTTTIRNDWRYRGNAKFTGDTSTSTVKLSSCTFNVVIYGTGTVRAAKFEGDGTGLTNITLANALNWNTMEVTTDTLKQGDMLRYDSATSKWVLISSGTAGSFLRDDFTWNSPAGGGDMLKSIYDTDDSGIVDNSIELATHTYDHFVTTTTNQTIDGAKTFSSTTTFNDEVRLPALEKLYLDGGSNTYLFETAADTVAIVAGGTSAAQFTPTGLVGSWKRIEYQVLAASATTITTTATLDLDTDLEYKFLLYGVCGLAGSVFLKPAGIAAGTPYTCMKIFSDGTTVTTDHTHQNNSGISIGYTGNYFTMFFIEGTFVRIKNYASGAFGFCLYMGNACYFDTDSQFIQAHHSGTLQNNVAVTYFDFATQPNGFGIGTVLEVWARR